MMAQARGYGKQVGKFRSKFEARVAKQLKESGCPWEYESQTIYYVEPSKVRRYIPDILLLNSGILIEVKGLLTIEDRKKMILVKQQWPDLDIRFAFMRSKNTISKKSKTTYAMWADKNGFPYCDIQIPATWLSWANTKEERKLIATTLKKMSKELAIKQYKEHHEDL